MNAELVPVRVYDNCGPAAGQLDVAAGGIQHDVVVQDDPSSHDYPLATEAAGRDEIFVGRVRRDVSIAGDRGLAFWVVSDNLRKGAATNAVELADVLQERDWIRPAGARGATPYRAPRDPDSVDTPEATA